MRIYELILILKSSLSEAQRKKMIDGIKKLLKNIKIAKEEEWGKKDLTFKIRKETTGYYLSALLEGDLIPSDFEKKLLAEEDILRHLLIRKK